MKKIIDWLAYGFVLLYGLAGALVSVHRHWQFETGYYDFGIFDRAIWQVSRFSAPIIDHLAIGGKVIFADHFSPSIFLLSPLYWLTQRSEIILIAQAVLIASSVLALYVLGKRLLGNPVISLCVAIAYALFIGIQNAVITDFHEITLLPLPLALLFLSIEQGWKKRYVLFLFLCLGVKEHIALLGVSIGIFLLLTKPAWRAIAVATIGISIAWGLVATRIIIPYFSEGASQYTATIPANIVAFVQSFYDHPIKQQTIAIGFGNFLFLPLLYPPLFPALIQELASRFLLTQSTLRWSLSLHYGTELGILAAISSLYALRWLQKFALSKHLVWILGFAMVFLSMYLHQFALHGPLGLSYNRAFYRHSGEFGFLNTLIDRVPAGASVMTQNNLAAHFTHQPVMLFRLDYTPFMPDYVIFDLRSGQNPNNMFPQNMEILTDLRDKITHDSLYRSIYETNDQAVFEKTNKK